RASAAGSIRHRAAGGEEVVGSHGDPQSRRPVPLGGSRRCAIRGDRGGRNRSATVDRLPATVDTGPEAWHGGVVSELNATAAALLGLLHDGPQTGGQLV